MTIKVEVEVDAKEIAEDIMTKIGEMDFKEYLPAGAKLTVADDEDIYLEVLKAMLPKIQEDIEFYTEWKEKRTRCYPIGFLNEEV